MTRTNEILELTIQQAKDDTYIQSPESNVLSLEDLGKFNIYEAFNPETPYVKSLRNYKGCTIHGATYMKMRKDGKSTRCTECGKTRSREHARRRARKNLAAGLTSAGKPRQRNKKIRVDALVPKKY